MSKSVGSQSSVGAPSMCYLDWDCTLTVNHMYHLLRPMERESSEAMKMWGTSTAKEGKDVGFARIVGRLSNQYALWGRKENRALRELETLTKNSTPLIDMENEQEKLVHGDLQVYLFGDEQRRTALDDFIQTMSANGGVCILTRGLTGCVYSCLLTYFSHWLRLQNIKIVDYAGQCLVGPTMEYSSLQHSRVKSKLVQIIEMEFSNSEQSERSCALIDDSYEEELDTGAISSKKLSNRLSFPLYGVSLPLSSRDGTDAVMHLRIGGTKRNGDGVTTHDFGTLKDFLLGKNGMVCKE